MAARNWRTRRCISMPQMPLSQKKIPVLGAGVMGSGVAHWAAKSKLQCYMKDISDEAVAAGMKFVDDEFRSKLKKKTMTQQDFDANMARVTAGTGNEGLKGCTVIIEAAVEVMDIKKKMIKELEDGGYLTKDTIFATNTSALSINELAASSKYPENVVGMHFFNPVGKMPLIEVITGKQTSRKAIATVYKLALEMGKFPIVCKDGPGFLVNRVLGIFMSEAGQMLLEGADFEKADKMLLDWGMPMGAYRLLDEVGIDVAAHVGPTLAVLGDRFIISDKVNQMVDKGLLGKKGGKGFYKYSAKGKQEGVNEDVLKMLEEEKAKGKGFNYDDLIDRCVLTMINETALILSEGLVATPEDCDLGMVFGTGFAPHTGGPLSFADNLGIDVVVAKLEGLAAKYGSRFAPTPKLVEMAKSKQRFFPNRPLVSLAGVQKPKPKIAFF
eukprot:NODE_406_length_1732_cov_108.959002_g300_i0.p1 GENE.NODE_406_length_1732_cov_108.959002_g300_i0~~NODE_406_length_1732_cov_108.959002_g300_i0.p1  ORF type:complete len:440 (-),score=166.26 NODE_406_length_1732_cov_108.959002_g300_i0:177-1496(-)